MSDTKAKIVEALDALPEARQQEVLDYVETLRAKAERAGPGDASEERDPEENPLFDLIGSVDKGLGADQVDDELYGEDPA